MDETASVSMVNNLGPEKCHWKLYSPTEDIVDAVGSERRAKARPELLGTTPNKIHH